GRRGLLTAATALGIGAGLSTHAIVSAANENEAPDRTQAKAPDKTSDISLRDRDLPFIGTEETFSTHELMVLNDRLFLEDTGLAELGPRRIGAM
ncbi:amidohydrolase, partial [Streptomyces turgidiscabies]